MLKNIITLSDGTEIRSGVPGEDSIISVSVTETVNKSKDLTPGDSNTAMMEATIWSGNVPALAQKVKHRFRLSKTDDNNVFQYPGSFVTSSLDYPTRTMLKIVGYNPLQDLDMNLSGWVSELTEWPYALRDFAAMVCRECGFGYEDADIPNGDFPVYKPDLKKVTGRQLLKWIGEICCRFLVMGNPILGLIPSVKFEWFTDSGVTLTPSGENYYYSGGQTYSPWEVPEVESVHVLWKDAYGDEYLVPSIGDYRDHNYYTITGNALIQALPKDEYGDPEDVDALHGYLNVIKQEMAGLSYTPCKLSCPARMDIRPGHIFHFVGHDGKLHKALCMKKITKGQKDTIECTGSQLRKQYHK